MIKLINENLKHMLTMTAGLDWDALSHRRSHPGHTTYQMYASSDPVKFVLNRNLSEIPGQKFYYNSGLTILLGEVVRRGSGMDIDEFSGKFLFTPLGISDYSWDKFPDGTIQTDGGLHLRPRDMAKIGYMMLKNGKWQEKQIISRDWVEESTKTHIDAVLPVFREGDTLYAKTGFWDKVELLPENESRFHGSSKKFGDFQVDVITDENGNVRQLIAHFELRSMYLDKVE